MELIGLLLAVPVVFLASLVYTGIIFVLYRRWPFVKKVAVPCSSFVIALMVVEIGLLILLGAKISFERLGLIYTILHLVNFYFIPPSLVNIVLAFKMKLGLQWLTYVAGVLLCWITGMMLLFGNIMIDDAIVGPDAGKPFYMNAVK